MHLYLKNFKYLVDLQNFLKLTVCFMYLFPRAQNSCAQVVSI